MLTTTTTIGLRAIGSAAAAAPCCTTTTTTTTAATRSILRSSSSPYSTFCPVGLRTGSNATASANSKNPLVLSSSQAPSPKSVPATAVATAAAATAATTAGGGGCPPAVPSTIRRESTMSSPPSSPNQSAQLHQQDPEQQRQPLNWQTFFTLRKSRRRYQVTFSAAGALGFSFGGAMFLSSPGGETILTYFPLDPFIGFGLGMTGFMALGWLLGPAAGNACFYLRHTKWKAQMTKKEIELFAKIKKNRVDPTASSASNPVPDFYGEKIQSLSGYRQWLKDQRAFNKKRTTFV